VNATLWKLPTALPNTPRPQYITTAIGDYDAYIQSVSVSIQQVSFHPHNN